MQAKQKTFSQLWKYGLTGVLVYITDLITYVIFIYIDEANYLVGNVAGRSVGACASFVMNRNWTFKSASHKNDAVTQGGLTLLIFFVNLFLSSLILDYAVTNLDLNGGWSRIVIDMVLIFFTFIFNKYIIFREH